MNSVWTISPLYFAFGFLIYSELPILPFISSRVPLFQLGFSSVSFTTEYRLCLSPITSQSLSSCSSLNLLLSGSFLIVSFSITNSPVTTTKTPVYCNYPQFWHTILTNCNQPATSHPGIANSRSRASSDRNHQITRPKQPPDPRPLPRQRPSSHDQGKN